MDITSVLKEVEAKYGEIYDSSIDAVTFEGKTYAFPVWGEGTALYYRKDLMKEVGLTNPPATWADYKKICKSNEQSF